jgi:hypothetical protein
MRWFRKYALLKTVSNFGQNVSFAKLFHMNCRSLAVRLLCVVGLVSMMQAAFAAHPTSRHVTATATILNIVTNDRANLQLEKRAVKFIGSDGRVTNIRTPNSRPIVIIDMP